MHYTFVSTNEFRDWLSTQSPRSQYQIDGRLAKIRCDGYFGNIKSVSQEEKGTLKNKVWEMKFNDGRRIYYAYIPEKNILLLLGGNKNGQDKDIRKAKKLYIEKVQKI